MNLQDIYKAVEKSSKEIVKGNNGLKKRLKSAKNFVASKDMKEWAFSKLVATEYLDKYYGSEAKPFFYAHSFINVFELDDSTFKREAVNRFLKWAESVKYYDLGSKFKSDNQYFELLVHTDLIPRKLIQIERFANKNRKAFIEGFKQEIIFENRYRNQSLIKEAKEMLDPICSVCNFNFEEKYGLHGKGFIEMHHLEPIKSGARKSTLKDLVPVCSNCHRMLHKGKVMLSVEDLKRIISEAARAAKAD